MIPATPRLTPSPGFGGGNNNSNWEDDNKWFGMFVKAKAVSISVGEARKFMQTLIENIK